MISTDYYSIAKEILTRAYPRRVKCLDSASRPYDEEIEGAWAKMTRNERGWYVLFSLVEYGGDWRALDAISPSPEVTAKYHKIYNDRRNAHNRDIIRMSFMDKWLKTVESFREGREDRREYNQSYSARDIPTELKIERPDHNPAAFTIRKGAGDDPTIPPTWLGPPRY